MRKFLPISVFLAGGLTFGNSAYQYLSVSYIQMLKSFTPVPMLVGGYIVGKEKPTLTQLVIVIVICGGLSMSTMGELSFSLVGFALQVNNIEPLFILQFNSFNSIPTSSLKFFLTDISNQNASAVICYDVRCFENHNARCNDVGS